MLTWINRDPTEMKKSLETFHLVDIFIGRNFREFMTPTCNFDFHTQRKVKSRNLSNLSPSGEGFSPKMVRFEPVRFSPSSKSF